MKLVLNQPHTKYHASDGTPLPGVTTITGMLPKPHLLGWYADMERQGVLNAVGGLLYPPGAAEPGWPLSALNRVLPRRANGKPLPFAEIKRDRAADLGTITHARCHAWDLGEELERDGLPADLYEQSQHGLDRYVAWVTEQGFKLVAAEKKVVYENALDSMRYGGTLDRLFTDGSLRKVLVDLKTSKRSQYWPYDDTFAQVAAYAEAEGGVDRVIVARIGKEPGDEIQVHELTDVERREGLIQFCAAYDIYQSKKRLERRR